MSPGDIIRIPGLTGTPAAATISLVRYLLRDIPIITGPLKTYGILYWSSIAGITDSLPSPYKPSAILNTISHFLPAARASIS